jgi:hypothetical protein
MTAVIGKERQISTRLSKATTTRDTVEVEPGFLSEFGGQYICLLKTIFIFEGLKIGHAGLDPASIYAS